MEESVIPIEAELTLFRTQLTALQRRRDRRYRCGLATAGKIHFVATGEVRVAWVFNLSLGGIGLEVPEPLNPGQEIVMHLKASGKTATVTLPARVMHTTPVANGAWRVGCRFAEKLTPDLLESLL